MAFHRTLLQASGNEMLAALDHGGGRGPRRSDPPRPDAGRPNPVAIRLHGDVACAVQAGDADAAASAMRAIIDEATSAISAVAAPS